ncbi:MAG: acetate/propionate family kinase [Planctomycetota bacterium]|nr:MAG: acetate/propionate family kinase [Planctomycetota bacterium]REJ93812.1 MAG: acetate/propionate family kinase [Planctomycetota bacterium]REK21148.1 MAG: acetate/propionate family kinase [Planctomycetota bacterium]REK29556.1 MAG: acetate/propionate family kinase [Planctomycetota bacterium]
MKILVANLGSTSFKYRLFDMETEAQLARGGIERIGQDAEGACFVEIGDRRIEVTQRVADHAAAVKICLDQLTDEESGCLANVEEVAAIGFKAVFAGKLSGVRIVDDPLLDAMESLSDVAPAHNPPYVRAMRQLREAFPRLPLVAALETGFHETIPAECRSYAVPYEWREDLGIQKWGFHGASHRYIGGRIAELTGRSDLKVISCHLGGSNSLCAMRDGVSVSNSLGMTPQTGLPHNNRVGDFDPFALPLLMRKTGKSLEELLDDLSARSGLLGMSGLSGDVRDLEEAAAGGHERADLALKVFAAEIRRYLGGYLVVLGGADAIVFTGGIGENSVRVRREVCAELDFAGIRLSQAKNEQVSGECRISEDESRTEIWVVPTNEELVVARQTEAIVDAPRRHGDTE